MQIDTADELMTTELMFNAVWKQLSTAQLVALLSCLVPCTEKDNTESEVRLPLELAGAVATLQETAGRICAITNVRHVHSIAR
jgi:ATP-dependent RNA helicase DOB1